MSGAGRAGGAQGGHRRARGAPRRWPPPVSDSPEPRKSCTLSSPKKDVHEIVDVGLQEDKPGKQGVQISHMLSRFQDTTRGREALKNCPSTGDYYLMRSLVAVQQWCGASIKKFAAHAVEFGEFANSVSTGRSLSHSLHQCAHHSFARANIDAKVFGGARWWDRKPSAGQSLGDPSR